VVVWTQGYRKGGIAKYAESIGNQLENVKGETKNMMVKII
jgi:hypothetical protein